MEDDKLEEIKSFLEDAIENTMEEKLEELADGIQERIEECTSDLISGAVEDSIETFLENHQFVLPDGTTVQSRNRTKVMSPDGKRVLVCYGGLRIDGKTLQIQERATAWRPLCSFESELEAVEALGKVNDAIEQGVSLLKL